MPTDQTYVRTPYRESSLDFIRPIEVNVTAAIVGVHRSRWKTTKTKEEAVRVMREHRFDVLPIDPGPPKPVQRYFATDEWGDWDKKGIHQQRIERIDVIPHDLPVLQLINRFALSDRHYFFLEHLDEIVGLVSVANLNSRDVKAALAAHFVTLEDRLADLVRTELDAETIEKALRAEARKDYEEARRTNYDLDPTQYLYFPDLVKLVGKHKLYGKLGYESRGRYRRVNSIVELRNAVAHPVKMLVTAKDPPRRLWKRIDKMRDLAFRLKQYARAVDVDGTGAGR